MHGKLLVGGAEAGREMVLEGLDGSLGDITTMDVRWHELVVDAFCFDGAFKRGGGFIIQLLELGFESVYYQVLMQLFVCS